MHDFEEADFGVKSFTKIYHAWIQGLGIDAVHFILEVGKDTLVRTLLGLDDDFGDTLLAPISYVHHLASIIQTLIVHIRQSGECTSDAIWQTFLWLNNTAGGKSIVLHLGIKLFAQQYAICALLGRQYPTDGAIPEVEQR